MYKSFKISVRSLCGKLPNIDEKIKNLNRDVYYVHEWLNITKLFIFPTLNCIVNAISVKIPVFFLIDKLILKLTAKGNKIRKAKKLNESKFGRFILPNFQTYYI